MKPEKWYDLEGEEAARAVVATFLAINEQVNKELDRHRRLKKLISPVPAASNNVARSIYETATSHFGSTKPKPYVKTDGGDYTLRRRASLLNQFAIGLANHLNLYGHTKKAFEDAWVCGDGYIQPVELDDDIKIEYVPNYEVRVDPVDGKYGDPQSIYRHKLVNKSVLMAMYPDYEDAIYRAGVVIDNDIYSDQADMMEEACSVVMGWRKESIAGAGDGRYIIAIDSATLEDGKWEDPELPIYRFSIGRQNDCYYSYGAVAPIVPIQQEIDEIHGKISAAYEHWAPKIGVEANSELKKDGWDKNSYFEILEGRFTMIVPQVVSPDLVQYLQMLRQQAYELSGISEMHASSKKVPGVEAGVAIRELNDIQSVRFQSVNQDYERFHLNIFEACIRIAKRIDARGAGGYKILSETRDGVKMIKWKDVELDDDRYQMSIWPTSMFSGSPSAQLQTAMEMAQAFPEIREHVLQQMDVPDVRSMLKRVNAPKDVIDKIVENIIDEGEYIGPEPFFDLASGINQVRLAYIGAIMDGVSEERLEMLRRWMAEADEILNPPLPPQPVMPNGMPGAPMLPPQEAVPPQMAQATPPQPQPPMPPGGPPVGA